MSLRSPSRAASSAPRGFTLLELLVALALFSVLGVAIVALLGQGLSLFSEGTADTSMQDRLQSILPMVVADLAAIQPAEPPEVLPPPLPENTDPNSLPKAPPQEAPAVRLRSGMVKLTDVGTDWPAFPYVALVRSNARESEDPLLRSAGTAGAGGGVTLRSYDPAAVDSGTKGNLLAPGGLLEVVWIAVPEDPNPERRTGPPAPDSSWNRGVLTLYRLFRAPAGGPRSLLDPANFDSLAKIRAAGRPIHEGLLYFGVTFRNVFSRSWLDGAGTGKAEDGTPYVGTVWDSTRALDKTFAFYRGPDSLEDVRDDVFPAMAHVDITLAIEGPFGFGRGETLLSKAASADEKKVVIDTIDYLFRPGPTERWLKVDTEWMSTTTGNVDVADRSVVVARAGRGTTAQEHQVSEPVYFGATVSADVPLVFKDRYARRK